MRLGVTMWQVLSPILIVVGSAVNILFIIVMWKGRSGAASPTINLISLAVSDMAALYIGLLPQWVKYSWDIDYTTVTDVSCKLQTWLEKSSLEIPGWILVTFTIDRVLAMAMSNRRRSVFGSRFSKVVFIVIPIAVLEINSHLLFGVGRVIRNDTGTLVTLCGPLTSQYADFYNDAWIWINLCKSTLLPFTILIFGSTYIVWKQFMSGRCSRNRIEPVMYTGESSVTRSAVNIWKRKTRSNNKTRILSILTVCLNFVFTTCTYPIVIYMIRKSLWNSAGIQGQISDPWWAMVNIFMYSKSPLNFLSYCVISPKFRNEVKKMFTRGKVTPRTNVIHELVSRSLEIHRPKISRPAIVY